MKALITTSPPDTESLQLINIPTIKPKHGQLGIRITSIGLNRGDLLYCQNRYFIKPEPNSRIGFEAAGIVDALPSTGSHHYKLGDRVALCPMTFDVQTQGGIAEYGIYDESSLLPSPDSVPDEHCGAIWMAYLTAWGGLVEAGCLKSGEHVVITAASSSVGIAAIQVANMLGAISIATTTSADKAAQIEKLGAQHVIVQDREDSKNLAYVDEINRITHNQGSDLVFDAVSGPGTHGLVKASKRGGRIVIQGMLDRRPMDIHAGVLMKRLLTFKGYTVDQTLDDPAQKSRAITAIMNGFKHKDLNCVISEQFKLNDYQKAFATLSDNRHMGKIIITP
jgi:NADPH:quinone reductase